MGSYYHSNFSSYSKGVSFLIHKSLQFTLLDLHFNSEGRYVILHAICDRRGTVHYSPGLILHKITPLLAQYPMANILLAGNFNMPPNPSLDKFSFDPVTDSPLSLWVEVYGLSDVWQDIFACRFMSVEAV